MMRSILLFVVMLIPIATNAQTRPAAHFTPLTELGTGKYKGFEGGLYPGGSNDRPAAHEKAGQALAKMIRPLNRDGKPADDGAIVLLSIGMSNTTQEFSAFMRLASQQSNLNPQLKLVDGAQGGMDGRIVSHPNELRGEHFWQTVSERLRQSGATAAQVQVIWLKEADARPTAPFPDHARQLQSELETILTHCSEEFPNLRMAYVSSRIYAGYASSALNPEPYAYESGFAVKWLIEKQINGASELNFDPAKDAIRSPWISWGPYLWADGTNSRADGLTWSREEFGPDGTHPGTLGRQKVAKLLLDFFSHDETTKAWFLKQDQ